MSWFLMKRSAIGLFCLTLLFVPSALLADEGVLKLNLRSRELQEDKTTFAVRQQPVEWQGQKTAVIICDMWDQHWCSDATDRVGEMVPRMNELVKRLRDSGALIIHCPSDTMSFYKDHPARRRAQEAPAATPEQITERTEGPFPIEVVHEGCTNDPVCRGGRAWSRQHKVLEIDPEKDAITDKGDEAYNLMHQRGIENVIIMGVHTNMCIIGRPFAIKAMASRGLNVALVRDMTDSMYSPKGKPYVDHFSGTDLVVEWLEKYWCSSITSDQLLGGKPFQFEADDRPRPEAVSVSPAAAFDPTDRYSTVEVEGWKVIVNNRLRDEEPELHAEALKVLGHQLYDVSRRVPEAACTKLRQVPIWLELDDPHHPCAVYHPDVNWLRRNGMNPDKAQCVEIANARRLLSWSKSQPMMLLHEMAHAYHHQFLENGSENEPVRQAYEHAKQSGAYDAVLRGTKTERHYALNNPMEYFAEATEAYFGTNDYFPFVAAELRTHDPRIFELLPRLWLVPEGSQP